MIPQKMRLRSLAGVSEDPVRKRAEKLVLEKKSRSVALFRVPKFGDGLFFFTQNSVRAKENAVISRLCFDITAFFLFRCK
jgi:hypothetical protein